MWRLTCWFCVNISRSFCIFLYAINIEFFVWTDQLTNFFKSRLKKTVWQMIVILLFMNCLYNKNGQSYERILKIIKIKWFHKTFSPKILTTQHNTFHVFIRIQVYMYNAWHFYEKKNMQHHALSGNWYNTGMEFGNLTHVVYFCVIIVG